MKRPAVSTGSGHLLAKKLIKPTDCLIAEPTPVRHPCIGQKGLCRLEMKFNGTPAHGSLYPVVGVSAMMEAISLLEYVKGMHGRKYPADERIREIIERSSGVLEEEFQIPDVREVLKKLMYNPGHNREGKSRMLLHSTAISTLSPGTLGLFAAKTC